MDDLNAGYTRFISQTAQSGLIDDFEEIARSKLTTLRMVFSGSRTKSVVRARHAMWRHQRKLGFSYPEIGALWGRDHTTILSAITKKVKPRKTRVVSLATQRERETRMFELEGRVSSLEAELVQLKSFVIGGVKEVG